MRNERKANTKDSFHGGVTDDHLHELISTPRYTLFAAAILTEVSPDTLISILKAAKNTITPLSINMEFKSQNSSSGDLMALVESIPDPENEFEEADSNLHLKQGAEIALSGIDELSRDVLLRSARGESSKQISQNINIPETTVRTKIAAARRKALRALNQANYRIQPEM